MKVLFIQPRYPDTFWSLRHTCRYHCDGFPQPEVAGKHSHGKCYRKSAKSHLNSTIYRSNQTKNKKIADKNWLRLNQTVNIRKSEAIKQNIESKKLYLSPIAIGVMGTPYIKGPDGNSDRSEVWDVAVRSETLDYGVKF